MGDLSRSGAPRDVLDYLAWWDYMLWRERHRADPAVEWQADLSWDEMAAIAGVEAPQIAPGELPMNVDLAVALYWPSAPPEPPVGADGQSTGSVG